MTRAVAEVMRGRRALVLDFDGPVCRVFAGHPASLVAAELQAHLEEHGVELPTQFATNRDPLKVLQWVGQDHPYLIRTIEDLLIAGEITAAASSAPTIGAEQVIEAAARSGWPVAIASNNSEHAINAYLDRQSLTEHISAVVGRPYAEPSRMKPRPDIVRLAVGRLGVGPELCVLIGDSPTDIEASIASGVLPIGYAKTPERRPGLATAGAGLLIDDMRDLIDVWVAA